MTRDEELQKELEKLYNYLLENSKPLEPEILELINKNIWELLA